MNTPLRELPADINDVRQSFGHRCFTIAQNVGLGDVSRYFWGVTAESTHTPTSVQKQLSQHAAAKANALPTIIVPGLSGDTASAIVGPFMCARKEMAVKGYETQVVWLNGRTGCDDNAQTLRDRVIAIADHYQSKVNVVGYSKGCADSMHMLVNHPQTHECVSALVSLGGIVLGSPLADTTPDWMRRIVQYTPLPTSKFGVGTAIRDLTCEFRQNWLEQNDLPDAIRYASIAAAPAPERVSKILRKTYKKLAAHSAYNDSQVIDRATLLPNSELLATVNADHWAIALPFSRRWTSLLTHTLVDQNDFPRTLLLQGIIEHLADTNSPVCE